MKLPSFDRGIASSCCRVDATSVICSGERRALASCHNATADVACTLSGSLPEWKLRTRSLSTPSSLADSTVSAQLTSAKRGRRNLERIVSKVRTEGDVQQGASFRPGVDLTQGERFAKHEAPHQSRFRSFRVHKSSQGMVESSRDRVNSRFSRRDRRTEMGKKKERIGTRRNRRTARIETIHTTGGK